MKYAKEDVIIWKDDKRLEGYGFRVWGDCTPTAVLNKANRDKVKHFIGELLSTEEGDEPFKVLNDRDDNPVLYPCIIIEKEPVKKIVPFDLSLKEDRDALMGKRICNEREDIVVTAFANIGGKWILEGNTETGEDILSHWFFADTGKPVGKEVEV